MNESTNHSPTENVIALLQDYTPHLIDQISPFISRLFNALANGHAFIFVHADEAELLAQASPVVGQSDAPLVLWGNRLFLGRMFQLEYDLANEIKRLSSPKYELAQPENIALSLQNWFPDERSRDQQTAAALALTQNFTVISGGPGTGKTTTVAKLLALLCGEQQPRIALVAPTGKAAARMSDALKNALSKMSGLPENVAVFLAQLSGQTVHRLLGLNPPQMLPEYHAQHRLPLDIVVVDEVSMLDSYLLLQLLQALPTHCRVILLGDENKLPSVNAGAVLSALVRSRFRLPENTQIQQILSSKQYEMLTPPVAKLTISQRFDDNSGIGCVAKAVVAGDANLAWAQFSRFPDQLIAQQKTPEQQANLLYQQQQNYWQSIDNQDIQTAFSHQTDVVVLAARRADAELFNQAYRKVLQRYGRIAQPDTVWFAGQMLLITRNDPATNLYNGDIGIVMRQDIGLTAYFFDSENTFRAVPLSRLPAHELAFAMTVHKSQGSEYEEVWLIPPKKSEDNESKQGFNRSLLYTAITRAKQKFVYWGDETSFQAACNNQETRRTALAQFLLKIDGNSINQ